MAQDQMIDGMPTSGTTGPVGGAAAQEGDAAPKPLQIEVAPNIVEHLGLNLYTNLPRVLVEFVANAFDADSPWVDIRLDGTAIEEARSELRAKWNSRRKAGEDLSTETPLAEQTLPECMQITIEDRGHGMSRDDLQQKFLRIARKRREGQGGALSEGKRPVMGRKGIGKLAGFGVARRLQVTTRPPGQDRAIRITLDYSKLAGVQKTEDVQVEEERLADGAGLDPSGTRIELSGLVYEPTQAKLLTISEKVAQYFAIVDPAEFEIRLNGVPIPPFTRDYAFAYPNPDLPVSDLVEHSLEMPEGDSVLIRYRMRFTGKKKQLDARERGVRIYARQRLAATPDLLDLKTGIHGFQNTHYLDGEVRADFIDEQRVDYIASNRQGLRWETSLLFSLREFLTSEMEAACREYQTTKDTTLSTRVRKDEFTRNAIESAELPPHRRRAALSIAKAMAAGLPAELEDPYYQETLPIVLRGLGFGDLMSTIAALAGSDSPHLSEAVKVVARVTAVEWDDYGKHVTARLRGIEALRKIYQAVNFSAADNEAELHDLLKTNPWLIDPTFWAFLTSNVTEKTLSEELSKQLAIDGHVQQGYDPHSSEETEPLASNRRPDLVFALSSFALARVVVVELKSPNTPLHVDHLRQLEDYMSDVKDFLRARGKPDVAVEGFLIGSRQRGKYAGRPKVRYLESAEKERGIETRWKVFDIGDLLERAENAHRELLDVFERAQKKAEGEGEGLEGE